MEKSRMKTAWSGGWRFWWMAVLACTGVVEAWTPADMEWESMCALLEGGLAAICDARIPFPDGIGESCCCTFSYPCGGPPWDLDWCYSDVCTPDPTKISFDYHNIDACDQISISIYNPILGTNVDVSLHTLASNLITMCECFAKGVDFATSTYREGLDLGEIDQGSGPFVEGAIEVQICLAENCMIPPFWGLLCYDSGTPEALAEMEERKEAETKDVLIVLPEIDDRAYARMAIALTKCAVSAGGDCSDIGNEFLGYLQDTLLALGEGLRTWGTRFLAFLLEPIRNTISALDALDAVLLSYDLNTCNVIAGQEAAYSTVLSDIATARSETEGLRTAASLIQTMADFQTAISTLTNMVNGMSSGSSAPTPEQASNMLSLPNKIIDILDAVDSFAEIADWVQNPQAGISSLNGLVNTHVSALEAKLEPVAQQTHSDCISFLNGLNGGLLAEAKTTLATALDGGIVNRLAQIVDIKETRVYPGIHIFMNTLTINRDLPLPEGISTKEFCLPDFEGMADSAGLGDVADAASDVADALSIPQNECWDVPWPADIDTSARLPDIPLIPGIIPWLKLTFPFHEPEQRGHEITAVHGVDLSPGASSLVSVSGATLESCRATAIQTIGAVGFVFNNDGTCLVKGSVQPGTTTPLENSDLSLYLLSDSDCYGKIPGFDIGGPLGAGVIQTDVHLSACKDYCDANLQCAGFFRTDNPLSCNYRGHLNTPVIMSDPSITDQYLYIKGACNPPHFAVIAGIDLRPNTSVLETIDVLGLEDCKLRAANTIGSTGFVRLIDGRCIIKDNITPLAPFVWTEVNTYVLVDRDCYGHVPHLSMGTEIGTHLFGATIFDCKRHCDTLDGCRGFTYIGEDCIFRGSLDVGPNDDYASSHDMYLKGECGSVAPSSASTNYALLLNMDLTPGDGSSDVGGLPSPAILNACEEGVIDNSLAQGFIHINGGCTFKRNFSPTVNVQSATNIHNFLNTGPDCYAAIPGLSMFDTDTPEPLHDLPGISIEACKLECDQDERCLGFRRYLWAEQNTRICKIMYPGNTAAPSSSGGVTYLKGTCKNNPNFALLPGMDILPDGDIIDSVSNLDLATCKVMAASIPGAAGFSHNNTDGRCIIKNAIAPAYTTTPFVSDSVDTYVLVDSDCYAQIPRFDIGTGLDIPGYDATITDVLPFCKEFCDLEPSCLGFSRTESGCDFRGSLAVGASGAVATPGANLFIKGDCGNSTASVSASNPQYFAVLPQINLTPLNGSADIGNHPAPAEIHLCTADAASSPVTMGFIHINGQCTFKDAFTTDVSVVTDPNIHNFVKTGPGCYAAIPGLSLFGLNNPDPFLAGLSVKECRAECDQDPADCIGFMRFMDHTRAFCKLMRRNNVVAPSHRVGTVTYIKGACNDKPYFAVIPGIDIRPDSDIHVIFLNASVAHNNPLIDHETCKSITASTPGSPGFAILNTGRCIVKNSLAPLNPYVWTLVDTFVLVDRDCYGFVPNFDTGYTGPVVSAPIPTVSIAACKAHCNSLGWSCHAFVHGNDNVCHFRGGLDPALGYNHGSAVGDFYVKGDCP